MELSKQEKEAGGVLDMDTKIVSTITSHGAGYLNKDLEKIVGFQTDKPFKRSMQPYGGIRMAEHLLLFPIFHQQNPAIPLSLDFPPK